MCGADVQPGAVGGDDWGVGMMVDELSFFIPLTPMGSERPRFARRGKFTTAYTAPKSLAWKSAAVESIRRQGFVGWGHKKGEPLEVAIVAVFQRPKTSKKGLYHIVKPDADNIEKLVWDSLVEAGVMVDDCHIAVCSAKKRYQHEDEEADDPVGVRIFIYKIEEGT